MRFLRSDSFPATEMIHFFIHAMNPCHGLLRFMGLKKLKELSRYFDIRGSGMKNARDVI